MIFLNFSKAFDTAFPEILVRKLRKYKLSEMIMRLVHNWLENSAQRVVINHSVSN